jgi:hypothetical protein
VVLGATYIWDGFILPFDWRSTQGRLGLRSLAEDLVWLSVCLACVRGARRYWVIWTAAFSLLSVATDSLFIVWPVTQQAFVSAQFIWAYGLCIAMLWGSLTEGGRRGTHHEIPG